MPDAELTISLVHLRERARLFCSRKKHADLADDFASYCIEHAIRGRWAPFKHMYVDFLREHLGSCRTVKNRKTGKKVVSKARDAKRAERRGSEPILEDYPTERDEIQHGHVPLSPAECPSRTDRRMLLARCEDLGHKGSTRAMAILFSLWGFTHPEIGELFGVSESRVCQILKASAPKRLPRG